MSYRFAGYLRMSWPLALAGAGIIGLGVAAQQPAPNSPQDAITAAQQQQPVARTRPEQQQNEHDRSQVFEPNNAAPSSTQLASQPEKGEFQGFDFSRDPLGAKRPMQSAEEIMREDMAAKPRVMQMQQQLLESRYDLSPHLDPSVKMSRGKPICVGPTARLQGGMTWTRLAAMQPDEIKAQHSFPYPPLPHPKHTPGGMVFPQMELKLLPRLERYDVDFDIPEAFLPEFPPAMFLQERPELGDVSRGEVVTVDNFDHLFRGILTPMELDGMRLLLTPLPQEEFNLTNDRKSPKPTMGVACLDCHVNGHTTGQIELDPQIRPQQRRLRLDTPSLRGMYAQLIHGSKRSIRSVRDFSRFEENRAAYFNGDQMHAEKKGAMILTADESAKMERMQNMFDWPPAPKLDVLGRLDPTKGTESELRGEKLFFGKAQCGACHPAPFYLDNSMHDLHLERFTAEPGDGPMKTTTLRGIKETPPYLHDGRCFTLEDTVEFFNLALGTKLTDQDRKDLVAFMRQL